MRRKPPASPRKSQDAEDRCGAKQRSSLGQPLLDRMNKALHDAGVPSGVVQRRDDFLSPDD